MLKEIKTKGSKVIVTIQCGYPVGNYEPEFEFECPNEFYAKLMADNVHEKMNKIIEEIRKIEYESGWSDAKKKKTKRTYFYSSMTTNKY